MKVKIYLLLACLFIIYIGTGSAGSLLGSAWPAISADIAAPISSQSLLIVIIYISATLGSATTQNLLARFRTWAPATVGILIAAIYVFSFSQARVFFVMPFIGAMFGYVYGMEGTIINGYASRHYKAMWMSWLHCFFGIGCTLGPAILSYFMLNMGSWRMGYRAVGWIEICIFALLFASYPLWKVHGPVIPQRKGALSGGPAAEPVVRVKSNRELFRLPGGTIIPVTMVFYCSFEVIVFFWATSFLTEEKGFSPGEAAGLMAFFYAAQVAGRVISGFLSIRFSDRYIIRVALAITAIAALTFAFAHGAVMAPALVVLGFASGPVFPLLIHEVPSIVGDANAQGVIGLQLAGANLGTAFVPLIVGVVANFAGFRVFPVFLIALIGVSIFLKTVQDRGAVRREGQSVCSR